MAELGTVGEERGLRALREAEQEVGGREVERVK